MRALYAVAREVLAKFGAGEVVKALDTTTAKVMVDSSVIEGDHDMFVSGNDAGAKAQVTELLRTFGWKHVIDLGDLTAARGQEMFVIFWVRLYGALKAPMFNIHVARSRGRVAHRRSCAAHTLPAGVV